MAEDTIEGGKNAKEYEGVDSSAMNTTTPATTGSGTGANNGSTDSVAATDSAAVSTTSTTVKESAETDKKNMNSSTTSVHANPYIPQNNNNNSSSSNGSNDENPKENLTQNTDSTNSASGFFKTAEGKTIEIRDVWASNLEEEMEMIRELIDQYPYVAMDTEFPGVVARPIGDFGDIAFQTLRCNVDMLKLIQLGLSFADENGNWVDGCTCWQFNFKFSLSGDMFAQDSIELLKTSGIDFEKFEKFGIDIQYFGELLMMSGLVLNENIRWISFHSSYDFGYLLKTLTCTDLPLEESAFLELLLIYFPGVYDVKYMMTAVEGLHGGLSSLADTLQLERIGPMHQAGSDSLLTAQTYFGLIKKHFNSECDDSRFRGELFGLGNNHTRYKSKYSNNMNGSNHNLSSISTGAAGPQQLLYSSAVHYGTQQLPSNNTIATGGNAFMYEDSQY